MVGVQCPERSFLPLTVENKETLTEGDGSDFELLGEAVCPHICTHRPQKRKELGLEWFSPVFLHISLSEQARKESR